MLKLKPSELRNTVRPGMAALTAAAAAFTILLGLAYSGTMNLETLSDYIHDRQVARAEKLAKRRQFKPMAGYRQAWR